MSPKEKVQILSRFCFVTPTNGGKWKVAGIGGRRSGQVGEQIAVIGLRHAAGHEVLLRFADGKIDSFIPHDLFPEP